MKQSWLMSLGALPLLVAGCTTNTTPGNDTEAALDPPTRAAPRATAADAFSRVAMEEVQPSTMTDQDITSLGGAQGRCLFRLTGDAYPSFVYGGDQATGTIKLNGKLVTLPVSGSGQYGASGLQVTLRTVEGGGARQAQREANLIVRLPGISEELGFRGYEECGADLQSAPT